MVAQLSLKNAWLPAATFFFLDSNSPCKDLLFSHSHNLCKNTSVLGGTVLKEARNSFFGLGVYLLKSKFRIEDKLRFP